MFIMLSVLEVTQRVPPTCTIKAGFTYDAPPPRPLFVFLPMTRVALTMDVVKGGGFVVFVVFESFVVFVGLIVLDVLAVVLAVVLVAVE